MLFECELSLEPSPNLVPSEVPASGHHGFVKWGHDAKVGKIPPSRATVQGRKPWRY